MADNDTSKLRYDDFIGNVQPDPAKPESTIMLSGFVGHGPEGHARVYPDPTLGTWYDIPEGDVVHSMPIPDSRLGGSFIWVRANSEIKPGSAAPAATETEAVQPQQAAAVGFDPTPRTFCFVCDLPKAAPAITPQPTPATHCFICPPNITPATICTLHGHCPPPPPTPATMCLICPPHQTLATLCTQLCTHGPVNCPPPHSAAPTLCAVPQTLPCSLLCLADPRAAAQVNAMPPTLWCTWVGCAPQGAAGGAEGLGGAPQAAAGVLPHTKFLCTQGLATFCGCTPGIDCNAPAPQPPHQTHFLCTQGLATFCGCTPGIDCGGLGARAPQQANATAVTVCVTDCVPPVNAMMRAPIEDPTLPTPQSACFVCDPQMAAAMQMRAQVGNLTQPTPQSLCFVCDPKMAAAMQPTPTVQTHCFICPPHTQAVHCWTAPVVCDTMQMPTPATRCFICPPVHQTLATICTQVGCPTHQIHCPTQPVVCNLQPTQPVVCGVMPPSFGCQQGGGQQQLEGVPAAPAHPNTAATLCTQPPACPPRTVHNSQCICPTPSAVHQCGGPAHPTLATLCTLPPGCPPHTIHNSQCICPTPSAVHQCGGQTFTPTIPQHTVVGMCPTFGLCPSMACTPMTPIQNGVFTPFGR